MNKSLLSQNQYRCFVNLFYFTTQRKDLSSSWIANPPEIVN